MAKKNKKKKKKDKKDKGILCFMDNSIEMQYNDIVNEIEVMQMKIKNADKKGKKKAKKKMKKGGFYPYYTELKARKHVIKDMEESNFLERVTRFFEEAKPVAIIISRLVAALIVAILAIESIQKMIKPETVDKLKNVYKIAMSF